MTDVPMHSSWRTWRSVLRGLSGRTVTDARALWDRHYTATLTITKPDGTTAPDDWYVWRFTDFAYQWHDCAPVPDGGIALTIVADERVHHSRGMTVDTIVPVDCVATRFYFDDTLGSDVGAPNPAADAAWWATIGNGTGANRRMLTKTQNTAASLSQGSGVPGTGTLPQNLRIAQHLWPLSGTGTLSGTVKMQALAHGDQQAIGGQQGQSQLVIRIVSADGLTVRGTALAAYDAATLDSPNWLGDGAFTNRKFPASAIWGANGATLTPVEWQAGDFLVVESGYHYINSSLGDEAGILFDNNGATDLPEDESTTAADNAWIEFSVAL